VLPVPAEFNAGEFPTPNFSVYHICYLVSIRSATRVQPVEHDACPFSPRSLGFLCVPPRPLHLCVKFVSFSFSILPFVTSSFRLLCHYLVAGSNFILAFAFFSTAARVYTNGKCASPAHNFNKSS